MFKIFRNDDTAYEAARHSWAHYIYNDFGGRNPTYKKLHHADCRTLDLKPGLKTTSVPKVCSDSRAELLAWILTNRGPEGSGYTLCQVCL